MNAEELLQRISRAINNNLAAVPLATYAAFSAQTKYNKNEPLAKHFKYF